jgi:hypothetical protein
MTEESTPRIIGELKTTQDYEDAFQAQIWFEGWIQHFPHVADLYRKQLAKVIFKRDRILVIADFTDKEWTLWCLTHPTPVARRWFGA